MLSISVSAVYLCESSLMLCKHSAERLKVGTSSTCLSNSSLLRSSSLKM